MSFQVSLFQFSKKENSTGRPAAGSGAYFSCVLKEGTGVLNPVITLDMGLNDSPTKYNYAYINAFGRYYFINEWINDGPLWSAVMSVDALASWKSYIGGSNLYVLRAAAAYDGQITDNKYPCKSDTVVYRDEMTTPWIHGSGENINITTDGVFICGIVTDAGDYGSVSYYAFTRTGLATLCAALMDTQLLEDNDFSLNDASFELQKSLIDPISYIKSCIWLPDSPGNYSFSNTAIVINGWSVTCSHAKVTNNPPYKVYNGTVNIRKHPYTSNRGNYMNLAPYTNITLDFPPFGLIDVDTTLTASASQIRVECVLDLINGDCVGRVRVDDYGIAAKLSARVGVPIQLSQITQDYIGAAVAAAGGVASGISALWDPVGAATGVASAIGNAVQAMAPKLTSTGSNGSFAHLRGRGHLHTTFFIPVADDISHNGRPLCQVRTVSSLPGYQLIQDGDVQAPATGEELRMIKTYLESGFFYE